MALDTASKRASALGFFGATRLIMPPPDSNIDQGDRQHLAHLYSGVLASSSAAQDPTQIGRPGGQAGQRQWRQIQVL